MNKLYIADMTRYNGKANNWVKKFHKYFRCSQCVNNKLLNIIYRFLYHNIKQKHGIEISYKTKIGRGLYLGHPYNITINENAVIGDNCNIHKGVTIGQENRGKRKGSPVIGNCVWIGVNSTIVGKCNIGSDVLIAPNSYVNCDIPDHSIVFGNPCIIKSKEYATEGYINNIS